MHPLEQRIQSLVLTPKQTEVTMLFLLTNGFQKLDNKELVKIMYPEKEVTNPYLVKQYLKIAAQKIEQALALPEAEFRILIEIEPLYKKLLI